jgi:hypothetical protein
MESESQHLRQTDKLLTEDPALRCSPARDYECLAAALAAVVLDKVLPQSHPGPPVSMYRMSLDRPTTERCSSLKGTPGSDIDYGFSL